MRLPPGAHSSIAGDQFNLPVTVSEQRTFEVTIVENLF
jgi:hypothetical protein